MGRKKIIQPDRRLERELKERKMAYKIRSVIFGALGSIFAIVGLIFLLKFHTVGAVVGLGVITFCLGFGMYGFTQNHPVCTIVYGVSMCVCTTASVIVTFIFFKYGVKSNVNIFLGMYTILIATLTFLSSFYSIKLGMIGIKHQRRRKKNVIRVYQMESDHGKKQLEHVLPNYSHVIPIDPPFKPPPPSLPPNNPKTLDYYFYNYQHFHPPVDDSYKIKYGKNFPVKAIPSFVQPATII